jgi:hypothetical protein
MDFLKDRQETSKRDFPPTQTLTLTTTTIGPIATSKTNPNWEMKNRLKRRAPRTHQTRPLSQNIRPHAPRWLVQIRFKSPTGQPLFWLTVSTSLVNSDHRPDDNITRMGKVAIVRDIGAITLVRPSANRFWWLTGGLQLRGDVVLLIHRRDRVYPVQFGPSSGTLRVRTNEDRGLEHGETTVSIGEVDLSTC